MLSKSQARWFFILFTAGFSVVFLLLTVDTVRSVPERSQEAKMTAQVVHGKELWEANNCMGCHTILGEGAYYAPELTKVVERRGVGWIKAFIKDPAAMFPGQRRMVKYDFTDEEIDALIAFLGWIGEIDTNGFPAKPDLGVKVASAAPAGANPHAGAPEVFTSLCVACHAVGGQGGVVGPALDDVAARYSPQALDAWLKDPAAIKPGTTMPNLGLDDAQRQALTRWLLGLKNQGGK
jgi:nitric oxide reductase subunit C